MEYQCCKPCRLKTQDIHANDDVGLFYFLLKVNLVTQITIILKFTHYPFLRRKTCSKIHWRHGVFSLFGDCPLALSESSSFILPLLCPLLRNSIFSATFLGRQVVIRLGRHLPFHFCHCYFSGAGGEWVGSSTLTSHHPSTSVMLRVVDFEHLSLDWWWPMAASSGPSTVSKKILFWNLQTRRVCLHFAMKYIFPNETLVNREALQLGGQFEWIASCRKTLMASMK